MLALFREWAFFRGYGTIFAALNLPLVLLQFAIVPASGFVAGLVCSFLWHPVAERVTCEQWGALVVLLLLFPPILLLDPVQRSSVLLFAVLAFPCTLVPFHRGINVGFRYWREGYWRNFVGLANDWERDSE